jgi:choline kinase
VGGIPILKRLVDNLCALGVNRLVVVVGHLKEQIREYLQLHATDMVVDYVFNPDYSTTNNIYSLWLARKQIREPFVMVESDLVFEPHMLKGLLKPDRMAISRMLPWMNGTTVEICSDERITAFRMSRTILKERKELDKAKQYKTVNLYSFSMDSWYKIDECLTRFVEKGMLGEYYEAAFAELVGEGKLSFKAVFFNEDLWYEIDTLKDLGEAEKLFSGSLSGGRSQKSSFPVVQPAA